MRLRNPAGKRVPYNECVDWFSLGCILYEFLRGMSPFRTERALEWCADTIQDKVIRRLSGLGGRVPPNELMVSHPVVMVICMMSAVFVSLFDLIFTLTTTLTRMYVLVSNPTGEARGQGDVGNGTRVSSKILR